MAVYPDLWKTIFWGDNSCNVSLASARLRTAAWWGAYEPSGMIHEILTSDVEFARGMMNSSHSDVEILAYLTSRGIPAAKATELLADLRHGRNPIAQMPVGPSGGSSLAADRPRKAVAEAHQRSDSPRGRSQRGKHKRAGIAWWFVILVIIFVWAFGYALLNMGTDASRDVIDKSKHELPPPPGK